MREENRIDNIEEIFVLLLHMKDLDKLMVPFRQALTKDGQPTLWILKPFLRAIATATFSFDDAKTVFEKFISFFINPATIITLATFGITTDFDIINAQLPPIIETLSGKSGWILAIGLYLVAVIKSFSRQLKVNDPTFDLNAFKAIHPDIYQLFRVFKNSEPHTFETVYNAVERLRDGNVEYMKKAITEITKLSDEKRELLERIQKADEIFSQLTSELDFKTSLSESAITVMQSTDDSGVVHKDALHLISDYVLLKRSGDTLITLAKHNAYNTPEVIDMNDPNKESWAVVIAARADKKTEHLQMDQSHDRVVVANRFDIKGVTYIYSCHFPQRNFEEYTYMITDEKFQSLLYSIVLRYTESRKGGK